MAECNVTITRLDPNNIALSETVGDKSSIHRSTLHLAHIWPNTLLTYIFETLPLDGSKFELSLCHLGATVDAYTSSLVNNGDDIPLFAATDTVKEKTYRHDFTKVEVPTFPWTTELLFENLNSS